MPIDDGAIGKLLRREIIATMTGSPEKISYDAKCFWTERSRTSGTHLPALTIRTLCPMPPKISPTASAKTA